eukprot:358358-Chlamydomonas_euryale.AAC.1
MLPMLRANTIHQTCPATHTLTANFNTLTATLDATTKTLDTMVPSLTRRPPNTTQWPKHWTYWDRGVQIGPSRALQRAVFRDPSDAHTFTRPHLVHTSTPGAPRAGRLDQG